MNEAAVQAGERWRRRFSEAVASEPGGYWTVIPLPLFFGIWRALY